MGFWEWLFGRRRPQVERTAGRRQVQVAKVAATASYIPLLDAFPSLSAVKTDEWDFYFTTAATHFALIHNDSEDFRNGVEEELKSKYHDGLPAVSDCSGFVQRALRNVTGATREAQALKYTLNAHGMWVLWNLLERQPSREEAAIAAAIGSQIRHTVVTGRSHKDTYSSAGE